MINMRRYFRRNELLIYRGIFCVVFVITLCILIKGFTVFASDELKNTMKKVGVYAMQSLYVNSLTEENSYYRYVITNQPVNSNLITNMADGFAINYYAARSDDGSAVATEEGTTTKDIFNYEIAENEDEDNRHYIKIDGDLEAMARAENESIVQNGSGGRLEIIFTEGKVSYIENYDSSSSMKDYVIDGGADFAVSVSNLIKSQYSLKQLKQIDYLMNNFYIIDGSTKVVPEVFDTDKLLSMDLTIKKGNEDPEILIYHTHASETYIDSREGVQEDTVVGPGSYLAELLEDYGYSVYHDKTAYDMKNGVSNRNYAYSTARPEIEKILEKYPSIKVIIDVHRDSGNKRVTTINGKEMAQVMLFNGLCRNADGPLENLENKNLQSNLAFSLQTNLVGRSLFPGLMYRIYLKNYRYNQHLVERYLLVELGTDQNTVEQAFNSMEPLAVVIDQVLSNR